MTSNITEADAVLFIITTASVKAVEAPKSEGSAVKFEMQMATARRTAGEKMRLIGIYREGDKPPAHLRDHRYADFRDDTKYEVNFRTLVNDLLGRISVPAIGGQSESPESMTDEANTKAESIPSDIQDLIGRLKHGDVGTRKNTALGLRSSAFQGQEDLKLFVPALIEALDDSNDGVYQLITDTLGYMGEAAKDAVPKLAQKLGSMDWTRRDRAAGTLCKIGTPEALKVLEAHEQRK